MRIYKYIYRCVCACLRICRRIGEGIDVHTYFYMTSIVPDNARPVPGRKFRKNEAGYKTSTAYRKAFEVQKQWSVENVKPCETSGMNQWTNESLNQWTHEPVNYQWMKNQWTIQSVNQWTNEAMNRWINDSVNLWINDSGNQRINQSKQRNNEPMNQGSETTNRWNNQWSDELHESLNQWISEPFNHWTNESMKAWLSDCMNQWIKEWTNEGMDGWVNYFFVDLLLHWGTSSLSYFFSDQLLIWVTSSLARFCYELPSSVASATQFFFSFFCNLQWQFRLAHTWPDAGRTTFHAAAPTMSCNPTEQESGNIADAFPCHAANEPRHSRLQTRI